MKEDFLSERNRAEDIILGSLGFGEEASIVEVSFTADGFYKGTGRWPDGETFEFESDDTPGELEAWALKVLGAKKVSNAA
ncbi:MAG: hypothetical protein J0M12_13585 [Deltaproteobacteria bacterium]|nr:hypothetical protein [Deltaproteobacteria bacterium]